MTATTTPCIDCDDVDCRDDDGALCSCPCHRTFDLVYLSLGAGVQSTAVLAMSALGLRDCPRAAVAVFADTGDEPQYVYDHLERLEKWVKPKGIEILRVQDRGTLSDKVLKGVPVAGRENDRFVTIPAFVSGQERVGDRCEECGGAGYQHERTRSDPSTQGAVEVECATCEGTGKINWRLVNTGEGTPLRRQCTREFKIDVIRRAVRARLGVEKGRVVKQKVAALIGISLDEAIRAKDSKDRWITNVFPLLDARMRREDCLRLIADVGLPTPEKSACIFCPYHSNEYWRFLRDEHPAEWQKAIAFDEKIRRLQTVRGDVFLHRSLKPLAQVKLDPDTGDLFGEDCSGICGV